MGICWVSLVFSVAGRKIEKKGEKERSRSRGVHRGEEMYGFAGVFWLCEYFGL